MKTLFAFMILGLLGTQSAIINNNEIDGPNNIVYFGQGNKLSGQDNKAAGYNNKINGVGNGAIGKQNTLEGTNNLVAGIGNQVSGQQNLVIGQGNLVIGPNSSQQDIQKVNQRLADIFAARGLGNVLGLNNVQSQPQSQSQSQSQSQVKTQNQPQIQTQTVTSVINQVPTLTQSQIQPQSQQQVSVQTKPLTETSISSQVKIQPLIQQTKVEQQKIKSTPLKQVKKQVILEVNSDTLPVDSQNNNKNEQISQQKIIPAPKLQVEPTLDVKQVSQPQQKKPQQSITKLQTQRIQQKQSGDNILFKPIVSHNKQIQPTVNTGDSNTLQIIHQRQVPIQTTVKPIEKVSPAQQSQQNKIISLKQDKSFLFVIHDDTKQKTPQKSLKSQQRIQGQSGQQTQKNQPQSSQQQRYRRVNYISPQLRSSYPKINENSNRLLTVIQTPTLLSQIRNIFTNKNYRKSNNLRRNNDQIDIIEDKIDNGEFTNANEVATGAIASGSQNVILVSSGDYNNVNNNNKNY